jgi:general secretion pathway protein I
MRSNSQKGFTLLEVLVATIILAVAVSALMANLSTSTANLFRVNDMDRLTFLSKRKMDELLAVQNLRRGVILEGVLEADAKDKPVAGFRAQILPFGSISQSAQERLERVRLETWLQTGSKRRTLLLESFRLVKVQ